MKFKPFLEQSQAEIKLLQVSVNKDGEELKF